MITAIVLRNKETNEELDLFERIKVRQPLMIKKETSYEVESSASYAVRKKSKYKPRKVSLLTQFRTTADRDFVTVFINTQDQYELLITQDNRIWLTEVIVESNEVSKIQVDSYEVYSLDLIQLMDFRSLGNKPIFSMGSGQSSVPNAPDKYTYTYTYTYGNSTVQNSQAIKNTSVKSSPVRIEIEGQSLDPSWRLSTLDGEDIISGGVFANISSGSKLVIDSWYSNPQILIDGISHREIQDFSGFTFFTIPRGDSILTINNATNAQVFAYDERELF